MILHCSSVLRNIYGYVDASLHYEKSVGGSAQERGRVMEITSNCETIHAGTIKGTVKLKGIIIRKVHHATGE